MLFAELFSGTQLVLFGLSILVAAFLLRRSVTLSKRAKSRDVAAEVGAEMRQVEKSSSALIRNLEVRLHDYGREVEGRMQSRIAKLDKLVVEADREIDRLRQLLAEQPQTSQPSPQPSQSVAMNPGPDIVGRSPAASANAIAAVESNGSNATVAGPLNFEQRSMVTHLADAGFVTAEIAHLLERPVSQIDAVVDDAKTSKRVKAA
jgi:hypothetical protein